MKQLTRRELLRKSIAGAGVLSAGCWTGPYLNAAVAELPAATDRIEIGKSGVKVSRVAMGTGFNGYNRSSNQTRAGQSSFTELIRHGLDTGLNFLDMADQYGSHPFMKVALNGVKRDKVTLLSKIWFSGGGGIQPTDTAKPEVERFLSEIGVDYLDICLMHCLQDDKWQSHRKKMMDEMSELKRKGVIRNVGVSCHHLGALKLAAEDPWIDVIFARINPMAKAMDVAKPELVPEVAETLKKARKNGKFVVGMKIYGAGQLVGAEQRDASLRYVWGNKLVDAMTIGFEKPAQVDDTVSHLNRVLKSV